MVTLSMLWMPIVVSAVVVFIAGFLQWMVLPHHKNDWPRLPDEDAFAAAVNAQSVPAPGQYSFPHATTKEEWESDEWKAKADRGPVGFLILKPNGSPNMGTSLAIQFVYLLVISTFVAYLAGRTMAAGTHYLEVFQVAGTAAVLAYAGAVPLNSIWFGNSWSMTFKNIADGVVNGLLTAGIFGWLWP